MAKALAKKNGTSAGKPAAPQASIQVPVAHVELSESNHEHQLAMAGRINLGRRTSISVNLTGPDALTFLQVREALNRMDARLEDGTHVGDSNANVIRWLMQQIASCQ